MAGKSEPKTSDMLAQKKRSKTDETDEEEKKDKTTCIGVRSAKYFRNPPQKYLYKMSEGSV